MKRFLDDDPPKPQNVGMPILLRQKERFCILGPRDYHSGCTLTFAPVGVCLNPSPEIIGTSGTERGCSWSFVPFLSDIYVKERVFGSVQNHGPRQPNRHERHVFLHIHATANCCPRHLRVGLAVWEKRSLWMFFT